MSAQSQQVLADALQLSALDRAELIEKLLRSFDFQDRLEIDAKWADEAEARIAAFESGEISAISADRVFAEIEPTPQK